MRLPYMFIVGDGVAFNANPVSGFALGGPGQDGGPLIMQVVDQYGAPVVNSPVQFSVSPRGSVTLQSVNGQAAAQPIVYGRVPPPCSPTSSTTGVTCRTDAYGMAYVEVMLGSQTGSPTITARAAGTSFSLGANIVDLPQLNSTQSAITPGSYIALLGNNLVDPNALASSSGDYAPVIGSPICPPTECLPLTVDFVNVSFDVPSAGISLPGYVLFVSPTEVDVQAPWELAGQTNVQVKVMMDGLFGNVVTVPITSYSPSFLDDGNGNVVAYDNKSNAYVSSTTPAHAGDSVSLYANGLGPVNNQPPSGYPAQTSPASTTTTTPVVMIGGKQATVTYSGLAAGDPAQDQIDVTIPSGLTGNQKVTVAIGGQTSPALNLAVQ